MMLREFMVKKPFAVRPDDSLYHASQLMAWTETRHLPVTVEDSRLVGILSERDVLAYRSQQPDMDPRATPVALAMRANPQTAAPDSSLSEAAARLASNHIGCLPITERGKLVGLVTRSDVLSAEVRASMTAPSSALCVAEVMTRDPVTAAPEDELVDAARKMSFTGVRHLPVVDDNGLAVGILSDSDIQRALLNPEEVVNSVAGGEPRLLVRDAMSCPPMRLAPGDGCAAVAAEFVRLRASAALVITDSDRLAGIVSYVDILRTIVPSQSSASL